jgi:hypothetical protein
LKLKSTSVEVEVVKCEVEKRKKMEKGLLGVKLQRSIHGALSGIGIEGKKEKERRLCVSALSIIHNHNNNAVSTLI